MELNRIMCPNCNHEFQVEEALSKQTEARLKEEYDQKYAQQLSTINDRKKALEEKERAMEAYKEKEEEIFKKKMKDELAKEKSKISEDVKKDYENQLKLMQEKREKDEEKLNQLQKRELELMRSQDELKANQDKVKFEMEKEFIAKRGELSDQVRKEEAEKNRLKEAEFHKQLEDQKKLIEEMKRKAEQGSMQMQGEVMELVLEDLLRHEFPHDLIDEVGKGIKGADIIQTVVNGFQQPCGKIIYETKRTKTYQAAWIEKLKEDQRASGANISVLVTEVMPKDMDRFGQREGVWICSFQECKNLAFVLREMLLREYSLRSAEENKGDKMELLYGYLTSDEFKQRVEAIVNGFTSMKSDIDKEQRAMRRIWKEREKQLEKVISNTIDMYGSVKGIAGSAIGTVEALELPDPGSNDGELDF